MARSPTALLVDTDIFIDYLNGIEWTREILDSSRYRVYYSTVTRKELLAKPSLSSTERRRIQMLLLGHRSIPIDEKVAEHFSRLLQKYSHHGLRKADALVAATAWSRRLRLLTRNTRHYRFISEITLIDPLHLKP
ncbi:MAG: type II toxin-antitoxin system VapC family toxin [Deltaproteobacteria bacterium]|nr:type II toxin-antitoxin system VapC family toxin [Deltaproteobacteria bacterium]